MELIAKVRDAYRLQDYAERPGIDGVRLVELRRFRDEGGSIVELLRTGDGAVPELEGFVPAQVNYSTVEPGVVKAFHVHRRQTDVWFVPPEDRVLVLLVDVREGSPSAERAARLMLGGGRAALLRIPPGVAHGCRNLGSRTARIIYFTDLQFSADPSECDEGRLPWDLAGTEAWEPVRE